MFFQKLFGGLSKNSKPQKNSPPKSRRLHLESLENREMLSLTGITLESVTDSNNMLWYDGSTTTWQYEQGTSVVSDAMLVLQDAKGMATLNLAATSNASSGSLRWQFLNVDAYKYWTIVGAESSNTGAVSAELTWNMQGNDPTRHFTIQVWEDLNNNGIFDTGENSKTVEIIVDWAKVSANVFPPVHGSDIPVLFDYNGNDFPDVLDFANYWFGVGHTNWDIRAGSNLASSLFFQQYSAIPNHTWGYGFSDPYAYEGIPLMGNIIADGICTVEGHSGAYIHQSFAVTSVSNYLGLLGYTQDLHDNPGVYKLVDDENGSSHHCTDTALEALRQAGIDIPLPRQSQPVPLPDLMVTHLQQAMSAGYEGLIQAEMPFFYQMLVSDQFDYIYEGYSPGALSAYLEANGGTVGSIPASTLNSPFLSVTTEEMKIVVTTLDDIVEDDDLISLREAILYAGTDGWGTTITFAEELYGQTIILNGGLLINKNITIDASGANITIDANKQSRVFDIASGTTVILTGLTITGGQANSYGGISNTGTLIVTDCTISGNTASSNGGGIGNFGKLTVTNSTISENTATASGGGIFNFGTLTVISSTITGNSARHGGAIFIGNSGTQTVTTITNSLIASNTATTGNGGGIHIGNSGNTLTVTNCTIVNNEAVSGSGIYNSGGTIVLNNTIVARNVRDDDIYDNRSGSGDISGSHNLIGNGDGMLHQIADGVSGNIVGTGAYPVNPVFVNETQGNYRLRSGSPARDVGNNALIPVGITTDLDGNDRIFNDIVDMGAYELITRPPATPVKFSSTGRTVDSITMTWNIVTNATDYEIRYSVDGVSWGLPVTYDSPATIPGLTVNTLYWFQVRAVNEYGESGWSDAVSARTLFSTPTGLQSIGRTADSVVLAWNPVTGATGYEIQYRQTGSTGAWTTETVSGQTTFTRTINNLLANTPYDFQIRAIHDTQLNHSEWSSPSFSARTLLATPTGVRSTSKTDTSVTLVWNNVNGATGYTVQYRQSGSSGGWQDAGATTGLTITVPGLTLDTSYDFQVRATHDSNDNDSAWSSSVVVWTMPITATEYGELRTLYPELNLSANWNDYNIIVPSQTGNNTATNFQNALNEANTTQGNDLIVVRVTAISQPIAHNATFTINTNANTAGSVIIAALPGSGVSEENFILSGSNARRVLTIGTNANVALAGVNIVNGRVTTGTGAASMGAGISNSGTLLLVKANITGNVATVAAGGGAGIYNNGSLTVYRSSFSDNQGNNGAAVNNAANRTAIFTDCVFDGNSANVATGNGSALFNAGTIELYQSTLTGNTAINGGAINNNTTASVATLVNCDIRENTATATAANNGYGGAIYNNGTVSITSSLIAANVATGTGTRGTGGGIYNAAGRTATLTNCTVSANTAPNGPGIFNAATGTLNLRNSIVTLNGISGTSINGPVSENVTNFIDRDPKFEVAPIFDTNGALTNGEDVDFRLSISSHAIDIGTNSYVSSGNRDLDGKARIYSGPGIPYTVDLGAYEYSDSYTGRDNVSQRVVTTLEDSFDAADGEWSLREALFYARNGQTITFAGSLAGGTILLDTELLIQYSITIDAQTHAIVLDGQEKGRIAYLGAGTTVTFSGLTLQNGSADYGGAVYVSSGTTFTLQNSTIQDCFAVYDGGTIYNVGTLHVQNNSFTGNEAGQNGGVIYNTGILNVRANNTFSGNEAGQSGGVIYSTGSLTVQNSTFSGNVAGLDGGVIYSTGSLNLQNGSFSGNAAGRDGGAIYQQGATTAFSGSNTINWNTAGRHGGGLYITTALTPGNITLNYNTASGNGGAVYAVTDVTLGGNASILGNSATNGGGVYQVGGTLSINGTPMTNNTATGDGGAVYTGASSGTVSNGAVMEQNAANRGGGIFKTGAGTLQLTGTTTSISSNRAMDGAGVYVQSGSLTVNSPTIGNNIATGDGGGIWFAGTTATILGGTVVNDNQARQGGGLFMDRGTVSLNNVHLSSNNARMLGGGLYNATANVTIVNTIIEKNVAGSYGGGVYNLSSTNQGLFIQVSSITSNRASLGGGGISNNGALAVTNVTIANNEGRFGAGIYNVGSLTVNCATVVENSGSFGGGLYLYSGSVNTNNSIVALNGSDIEVRTGTMSGYNNLIGNGSRQTTFVSGLNGHIVGTETNPIDPKLIQNTATNGQTYYRPAWDSPVVGAGNSTRLPGGTTQDQIGQARLRGNALDMGAVQFYSAVPLPGIPTGFISTLQTNDSISLTWNAANNAGGYVLQYRKVGAADWIWANSQEVLTQRTFTIGELDAGTEYHFRLQAVALDGVEIAGGSGWIILYCSTRVAPPSAPGNFQWYAYSENSVSLSWNAIPDAAQYLLQYQKAGDTNWVAAKITTETKTVVSGLQNNTLYHFRVQTITGGIGSEWSEIVSVTTESPIAPDAPENLEVTVRSLDFVTMAWTGVAEAEKYELQYRVSGGTKWISAGTTAQTEITVAGLVSGTMYEFQVRALSWSGSSNWSSCDVETLQLMPETPTNLRSVTITSNTVDIGWDSDENAVSFDLQYKKSTDSNWSVISGITETTQSISGLLSLTDYQFQVRTVTKDCPSEWSNTLSVRTLVAAPSAPMNFRFTSQTADSIILAWNAGLNATSYKLEFFDNSGVGWSVLEENWTGLSYEHSGLTPNTAYLYRITAVNTTGSSGEVTCSVRTRLATPGRLKAIARGAGGVELTWSDVGADLYHVQRYDTSTQTWEMIATVIQAGFVDTSAQNDLLYNYRVVALGTATPGTINSSPSEIISVYNSTSTVMNAQTQLLVVDSQTSANGSYDKSFNNQLTKVSEWSGFTVEIWGLPYNADRITSFEDCVLTFDSDLFVCVSVESDYYNLTPMIAASVVTVAGTLKPEMSQITATEILLARVYFMPGQVGISKNTPSGQAVPVDSGIGVGATFNLEVQSGSVSENISADLMLNPFEATPVLADFNDDGKVDSSDFLAFAKVFGMTGVVSGSPFAKFDLNGDGKIDSSDFLLFAKSYGTARKVSESASMQSISAQTVQSISCLEVSLTGDAYSYLGDGSNFAETRNSFAYSNPQYEISGQRAFGTPVQSRPLAELETLGLAGNTVKTSLSPESSFSVNERLFEEWSGQLADTEVTPDWLMASNDMEIVLDVVFAELL